MTPDDERLEQLKEWWQENRWTIVGGVVLGLATIIGYNGWNQYTESQQVSASNLYEDIILAISEERFDDAVPKIEELTDEFPSAAYAGKAMLIQARIQYDRGEVEESKNSLQWVIDSGAEWSTVHSARLRLANLMIAEGAFEEALDLLEVGSTDGYDSQYSELRGDAQLALGRIEDANASYQAALDTLNSDSQYGQILELKINNTRFAEN